MAIDKTAFNELKKLLLQVSCDELSEMRQVDVFDPILELFVCQRRRPSARIERYVEDTVPTYSDPLFRAHFRMTRTSFQTHVPRRVSLGHWTHGAPRVDIERCFGLLKGKFRKLKYLDVSKVAVIPNIIITCCVLHNFIIQYESFDEEDIVQVPLQEGDFASIQEDSSSIGSSKRDDIMNMLA